MFDKPYCSPLNNECSKATVLPEIPFAAISMTCGAKSNHVWYTFTSATTGTVAVSTAHSDFDTTVSVYTGSCDSLTKVAFDHNSGACKTSLLFFDATEGVTYLFKASGM